MPTASTSAAPRSLVISPNLEALLEHDERMRRSKSGTGTSGSWSSTRSWGSVVSVEQPGVQSLPAPPRRGPRKVIPISPNSENEEPLLSPRDSQDISTPTTPRSSASTPNPYVNPSPTFEHILPVKDIKLARVPPRSSSIHLQKPEGGIPGSPRSPGDSPSFPQPSPSPRSSLQERAQRRGKLLKLRDTSGSMTSSHSRSRSTSLSSGISISSTVHFPNSSSEHASFIDLAVSPTQLQSATSLMVASSVKPPLPTSPKPGFNTLALKTTPKDKSNQLDAAARADLVRKSRKLAQVFGKTPEARALSSQPEWPPAEATIHLSANGRRHSSPLTPDHFSFLDHVKSESDGSEQSPIAEGSGRRSDSPTSFIDLSDNDDSMSSITTSWRSRPRQQSFLSAQSRLEKMTPEERAEEERRRKREKLAKLHRFLGSRVPTNLVLGLDDSSSLSLPPERIARAQTDTDDTKRKIWLRRRRSSSAAVFPSAWDHELERLKEDLNVQEKAINVRRALKMEKVFGVAPPQRLFRTRHAPSASVSVSSLTVRSMPIPTNLPVDEARSVSQPANKYKYKKSDRPGTSESSKQLIPKDRRSSDDYNHDPHRTSLVYTHYQHSLNSLTDIIDRDDKHSLRELHLYLTDPEPSLVEEPTPTEERTPDRPPSERRHSLPARPSLTSLASEYSMASPQPEVTEFQLRRRRAAKLTQFFGVDYRDLIRDVLESIENGLEHERRRGTLKPEEADDLLRKLRSLKTKRGGIL